MKRCQTAECTYFQIIFVHFDENEGKGDKMELNLQILREDLKDLECVGYFTDDRLIRRLSFPTIYKNEKAPEGHKIYITEASKLPDILDFEHVPSFICIGTPPDYLLTVRCNLLYTTQPVTVLELLDRISDLFQTYYQWETEMQNINLKNLPIKQLGKITEPIFKKPFSLMEPNFMTMFFIINKRHYELPPDYFDDSDYTYLSIDYIKQLQADPVYTETVDAIDPVIYSSDFYSYRTLCYNVRLKGVTLVRICVDGVGSPITDRDYALIKYFGEAVLNGMRRKDINNINQPKGFDEIMKKLLDHKMVPENIITAVLKENEWAIDDGFFCVSLEPLVYEKDDPSLNTLAIQISIYNFSNCFIDYQNRLIFVFNLKKSRTSREEILSTLIPQLQKCAFKAGISSVFADFKNLFYYYKQAEQALAIGNKKEPHLFFYRFEDYLLSYLVEKSQEKQIPEALCPEGLLRLIHYDENKKTNYAELLEIFLENNMSVAETTRKAYLHRSSFAYRIKKIQDILQMDLSNPDVRLSLLLAFKIMQS